MVSRRLQRTRRGDRNAQGTRSRRYVRRDSPAVPDIQPATRSLGADTSGVDSLAVALAHAEHLGSEFSSEHPHRLAGRGRLLDD